VTPRTVVLDRNTAETRITVSLSLDGQGRAEVSTGVPFLDHMLSLLARHAWFDLTLKAVGDTAVDAHHSVEDVGICLGQALAKALGDKKGIARFGSARVPMDEALADVVLDLSGRPFLVCNLPQLPEKVGEYPSELTEDFLQAFSSNAALTLHVNVPYGRNGHHVIEAVFKALAKALAQAVALAPREKGIPSTKGVL
jgi:imidazoleglycerol-phosphate dehydratase